MEDTNDILGKGWAFPPSFSKITNSVAMLANEEDINNSVYVILHTKIGERILRPDFGSTIHDLLFEPLNENMKTYMASSLKAALVNSEPRIDNILIVLSQPSEALGKIDISITYTIIDTNTTNNLVIPYFTPDNISNTL